MIRVALFAADEQACGFFRIREPARALLQAGGELEISVRDRIGSVAQRRDPDGSLHIDRLTHEPDFDVAVFQRPFARQVAEAIPALQQAGVAVVVDMDDDASALPGQHPSFPRLHPRWSPDHNWRHAETACQAADLVTVSTPPLAGRYAPHGRVRILPNCVPESWLTSTADLQAKHRKRADGPVVVGWTGAYVVHAGDLEVTRGGVARGLIGHHAVLRVVDHREAAAELAVPDDQVDVVGWQQIGPDYRQLVAGLDVGIAPLADHRFNEAKSALRGLEYAACGVPFVASPTAEYRQLAAMGAGLLAAKPKAWTAQLRRLLTSEGLRAELAGQGLGVARQMTFEACAWRWAEAWCAALERRRTGSTSSVG